MKKLNLPKHVELTYKETERLHGKITVKRELTVWPYAIAATIIITLAYIILK